MGSGVESTFYTGEITISGYTYCMSFEPADLKTLYTIAHLFGVALGAGGAFMSDVLYLNSIKDKRIGKVEFRFLKLGSMMVWVGLLVLFISGTLLFSLDPARYLASDKFLLKLTIVGVLTVNGLIFHFLHMPVIRRELGKNLSHDAFFKQKSLWMYISGAVSVVSWSLALILGAVRSIPVSYCVGLLLYGAIVVLATIMSLISRQAFFRR